MKQGVRSAPAEPRLFWTIVAGLTGVGFLLRFVTVGLTNRPTGNGALHFLPFVESIARGEFWRGFEVAVPPGGAAAAAPFWWWTRGDSELAFNTATLLAGTALIPIAAAVARRTFGSAAALWTAFFVALSSRSTMYAALTEVEIIYGFWVGLGLLFTLRWVDSLESGARRSAWLNSALAGLVFGAAIQSRPEGIALPFLATAFMLFVPYLRRVSALRDAELPEATPLEASSESRAEQPEAGNPDSSPQLTPAGYWFRLSCAALLFVAAGLVCTPYTLFLHDVTGQWHFSGKLNTHLLEDGDSHRLTEDLRYTIWEYTLRVEPFETASPLQSRTDAPIFRRWWRGVLRYLQNTPRYTEWVPILGLIGLIITLVHRKLSKAAGAISFTERRALWFMVGTLSFYYLALPIVLTTWRLFIPYLPILFALAAWGIVRTLRAFSPSTARWISLAAGLVFAILSLSSVERRHIRDYGWAWRNSPERRLGEKLKSLGLKSAELSSSESTRPATGTSERDSRDDRSPVIAFINDSTYYYADALHLIYPACTIADFDAHCRAREVQFVIIDSERIDPKRYPWHAGLQAGRQSESGRSALESIGFTWITTEVESNTGRELQLYSRVNATEKDADH